MDAGRVGDVMYSRLMWPGRAADSAADEVRIEGRLLHRRMKVGVRIR